MGFLRNWVLHNWWLKLLALLISFLLWSTYTAEPIVEVGYMVPIEFREIPADLEISGEVPTQAQVRVRGRSALLRRLTPADLTVSVSLARSSPGETLVRLTPDQVGTHLGATVVGIAPAEIRLHLAPRTAAR